MMAIGNYGQMEGNKRRTSMAQKVIDLMLGKTYFIGVVI